jgi:hypothetical protein
LPKSLATLSSIDKEAYAIKEMIRRIAPECRTHCSRWHEIAIKLSGLFAVLMGKEAVDADASERACELTRWSCKNFLSQLIKKPVAKRHDRLERLLYVFNMKNVRRISVSDLKFRHGFTFDKIKELLDLFPERITHEIVRNVGGGRPSAIIELKD